MKNSMNHLPELWVCSMTRLSDKTNALLVQFLSLNYFAGLEIYSRHRLACSNEQDVVARFLLLVAA